VWGYAPGQLFLMESGHGISQRNRFHPCYHATIRPNRSPPLIQTIANLFYQALKHNLPDAMARKKGGTFIPLSHAEIQARVENLARALRKRGLKQGDVVAILCENRPEWAITDYACAILGLPTVPIYPTMTAAQTSYILQDCGATWVFCSGREQLPKVLQVWPELPDLKMAVLLDGEIRQGEERPIITWTALQAEGAALDIEELGTEEGKVQAWAAERQASDILTIIYTSGTTGDPKGAVLTHGNLVSNVLGVLRIFDLYPGERCLSVLPLSHIYERAAGHYTMFRSGVCIYYAESFMSLASDLMDVRPQILLAVPRIFEKVYTRVRDTAIFGGFFKRMVLGWTLHVGHHVACYKFKGQKPPFWVTPAELVADFLVYRKVRARTGGRIRIAISGGAPLNRKIKEFFWAMGVPIFEGYGLTETSPILAVNRPGHVSPGTVGHPLWDEWEGKPFLKLAEDGEILARGPNIMQGYWRNETATREAIDEEGYFHTGDVGEWDGQGRLKITDRKKELLVTSGGKNVAPQPIENQLCTDPYIEQAMLLGDRQDFIAALIVPHFPTLKHWAQQHHLRFENDAELAALPQVKALLQRHVDHVNSKLSKYERVRRIIVLDQEMSTENGMLTPSLKIRRRLVLEAYADRIAEVYA